MSDSSEMLKALEMLRDSFTGNMPDLASFGEAGEKLSPSPEEAGNLHPCTEDCGGLNFCESIGVAGKTCQAGGFWENRCRQPDYAKIKLLADIVSSLKK